MLNGALTIGTLDGANIEMLEECGAENIYTFGFTVEQVQHRRQQGYDPYESLKNEELNLAIDQIRNGYFSSDDRSRFHDIINTLLTNGDYWMVLGDYQAYIDKQREVSRDFLNPQIWYSKCVHNIGAAAKFSSDRTIEEYAKDIWLDYYFRFCFFKKISTDLYRFYRHCTLNKDGRPDNIKKESSTTNHEEFSLHKSTDLLL
jgi:starch phosphorylase